MYLKKLLYISIVISFSSYSSALSDYFKPAEVRSVNKFVSATSESIKVETIIKGFAANDPYQLKNIEIPKTRMVSHLKTMGKLVKSNIWYAAWFAGMAAIGWAIDELTGEVKKQKTVTKYSGYTGSFNFPYQSYAEGELGALVKIVISQCSSSGYLNCATTVALTPAPAPWSKPENFIYTVTFNSPSNPSSFMSRDILFIVKTTESNVVGSEPVTDNDLFDSFNNGLLRNPDNSKNAFLDPDGYPYPNLFPQTEYIPDLSPEDQDLLKKYLEGALSTTHPEYARIAALAQALKDGKTQKEINELNENLKKPLTQAQLEETLKKERELEKNQIEQVKTNSDDTFKSIDDSYNKFIDDVKNTNSDKINELPQNRFLISGGGRCYIIDHEIKIMSSSFSFSTKSICDAYYYPYFLPILTWFFYISTGIYVWFSLRESFSRRI